MRSTYFILLCVAVAASGSKVNTADCSKETDTDRKNLCDMCVANPVKADFIAFDKWGSPSLLRVGVAAAAFDKYCPEPKTDPAKGEGRLPQNKTMHTRTLPR